jgi:hypothetical protein
MQRLLTSYVMAFNARHQRQGHLFQARYKSVLCLDDSYLLSLIRYIHLNPVRAGLVSEPGHWSWSSHRHYSSHIKSSFIDTELVHQTIQASGHAFGDWERQQGADFNPWPEITPEPKSPLLRGDCVETAGINDLALQLFPDAASRLELASKRRIRDVVRKKRVLARHAVMTGHSLASLARWFGCTVSAVHHLLHPNN